MPFNASWVLPLQIDLGTNYLVTKLVVQNGPGWTMNDNFGRLRVCTTALCSADEVLVYDVFDGALVG